MAAPVAAVSWLCPDSMTKPHSPACERNRDPILSVLRDYFSDSQNVLEIGSGTGQYAAYFASQLPQLTWQASDREEDLPGIRTWLDEAALPNTPPPLPLPLDVNGKWPDDKFDAVFSANTLHIMAWPDVERFFARLLHVTDIGATLIIYGSFNYDGRHSSESNAAFDQLLQARRSHMGIRDAEAVDALAKPAGFALIDDVAMPANNRCRIWRRISK